jgi:hypothetical protein
MVSSEATCKANRTPSMGYGDVLYDVEVNWGSV